MDLTANLRHKQGRTEDAPFDFSANMKKKAQWIRHKKQDNVLSRQNLRNW